MSLASTTLASLADVRSGGGAPQDESAFSQNGHPFVRAGSLIKLLNGAEENSLEKIEPAVAAAYGLKCFPADTVLFAKSGMSATKGHIYRLRQPAYVVNHLAALIPRQRGDGSFLVHALQRFSPTSLIKDPAYPSIRLGDIEAMEILAPHDIVERTRIAAILDQADALRRKRREALAALARLRQTIFRQSFGDPDENPRGWKRTRFDHLLAMPLRNGVSPASGGTVTRPVLTLSAVTGSRFAESAVKTAQFNSSPPANQKVDHRDFLICRGNGNKTLVGRGFFPSRDMPDVVFPDTIIAGRVDRMRVSPEFLECLWNMGATRRQIESRARTTNGTFKVNQSVLGAIELIDPPLDLQKTFAERLLAIEAQDLADKRQLNSIDALFASLQHRAFRGEL